MTKFALRPGQRVEMIDPPGTRVKEGDIGVALQTPSDTGQFWAYFNPSGRMHTRISEVNALADEVLQVSDLGNVCNFSEKFMASDDEICGSHATSVVFDPESPIFHMAWRCDQHQGRLRDGRTVEVVTAIPDFLRTQPRLE